jgi:hypothetical protein
MPQKIPGVGAEPQRLSFFDSRLNGMASLLIFSAARFHNASEEVILRIAGRLPRRRSYFPDARFWTTCEVCDARLREHLLRIQLPRDTLADYNESKFTSS